MLQLILLTALLLSPLQDPVKAQVINAGVGGNTTQNLLERMEADVLGSNPDLVILMIGINDMLNTRKRITYEEYTDNLEMLVRELKADEVKVLLMSSPPVDSTYLFERHDKSLFEEAPNEILDSARCIVRQIASENDLFFLDLFEKFTDLNLPRHNEDLFIKNPNNSGKRDGVHPTILGYRLIAEYVFHKLMENNLHEKEMMIICFGDSITNGGGANNYPSFLAEMIADFLQKN